MLNNISVLNLNTTIQYTFKLRAEHTQPVIITQF